MGLWDIFTRRGKKTKPVDPNAHVREYMDYFLGLPGAPFYAVMLTGPWGGGKTHFTKQLMRSLRKRGAKHVYVSLYGVRNREEFDRAVLAALYPFIASRTAKAGAAIIGGLLSNLRLTTKFSIEDYLDKFEARLIVFDDIERCDVSVATVLGYINPFVEHGGCKVVLLCNEAEIKEGELADYRRRKEKVVGQSLALRPDLDSALRHFIAQITQPDIRKFLADNASAIRQVTEQSGYGNLRVLQQSLWDFSRFYKAIPDELRVKTAGVKELLCPFLAFSIELKVGKLDQTVLNRRTRVVRLLSTLEKDNAPDPYDEIAKKYTGIELGEDLFSNDLLVEMFERGKFDPASIRENLQRNRHFASPADISSWRIVWDKEIWSDDEAENAITDMESKFKARDYVQQGEILHVFGLRLLLSEQGILSASRDAVIADCKAYVDDLRKADKLAPFAASAFSMDYSSYAGLGFTNKDTPEFKELFDYLIAGQESVLEESYPEQAQALLNEMKEDDALFWRRINYSNTSDTRYARTPIFSYIKAEQFVDELSKLSNIRQRSVLMALSSRYSSEQLRSDLARERPWLEKVHKLLLVKAGKSGPIAKVRIERVVHWTIGKVLKDIEIIEKELAEAAPAQPA